MLGLGLGVNKIVKFFGDLFSNTYSMKFDGVDEYVNIDAVQSALSATTEGTISFWFKLVDTTPASAEYFWSFCDTSLNTDIALFITSSGKIGFLGRIGGTIQTRVDVNAAVLSDNTWHHIVVTQDSTSAAPNIYVDGAKPAQTNSTSTDNTFFFNDAPLIDNGRIGCVNKNSGGNSNFLNGNVDDGTITNDSKSLAQIQTIYNSGSPKDESGLANLVSYYRMGDSANYNVDVANEWSFPDPISSNNAFSVNMEEVDRLFDIGYYMHFDGIDEVVNINNAHTALKTTTVGTWSTWFRTPDVTPSASSFIISFGDTNASTYMFIALNTAGKLYGAAYVSAGGKWQFEETAASLVDGRWYHLALVQTGTTPILYVNNVAVALTWVVTVDKTYWFNSFGVTLDNGRIGGINRLSLGDHGFFLGDINNTVFINRALTAPQIADIYNSGVPKDESGIANGVSYYEMGNANGDNWNVDVANEWTFVDQIGSNNAFTVNMEETDRTSEVPK